MLNCSCKSTPTAEAPWTGAPSRGLLRKAACTLRALSRERGRDEFSNYFFLSNQIDATPSLDNSRFQLQVDQLRAGPGALGGPRQAVAHREPLDVQAFKRKPDLPASNHRDVVEGICCIPDSCCYATCGRDGKLRCAACELVW